MARKFNVKEMVITDPKKSSVDVSRNVKGTGKVGRIIPMHVQNLLPNSRINYTPNTLCRFVPLAAPLMSSMSIRHHMFAVPYRQLWSDWEQFITGGEDGSDNSILPCIQMLDVAQAFKNWICPNLERVEGSRIVSVINSVRQVYQYNGYLSMYLQEFGEMDRQLLAYFGTSHSAWDNDMVYLWNKWYVTLMNEWIGCNSNLANLGYPTRDYVAFYDKYIGQKSDTDVTLDNVFTLTKTTNGAWMLTGLKIDPNGYSFDNTTAYNALPILALYRVWYYMFRDEHIDIVHYTPEEIKKMPLNGTHRIDAQSSLFKILFQPRCVSNTKDVFNTSTLQAYQNNAYVPVNDGNDDAASRFDLVDIDVYDAKTSDTHKVQVPATFLSQAKDVIDNNSIGEFGQPILPSAEKFGITGFSLANLKKVEALAKWMDKNLYGGYEYAEQLSTHFGIRYSDARMQIPEYCFGTKQFINAQVLTNNQTIDSSDGLASVAGDQAGSAQGITANDGGSYFAEEHCVFLDIMSIVPEISYKYATDGFLYYTNRFDFPFPEFSQLGSSLILKGNVANSILVNNDNPDADKNLEPFGYADRYWEAKTSFNTIRGKLQEDMPLYYFSPDVEFHTAFNNDPVLNSDFIHCVPSTDVFVSDSPEYEFVYDHNADTKITIPLPVVEYI